MTPSRPAWWQHGLVALASASLVVVTLRPGTGDRLEAGLPAPIGAARANPRLSDLLDAAEAAARTAPSVATVAELGRLYHANGYSEAAAACWELLAREDASDGRWTHYLAQLARVRSQQDAVAAYLATTVKRAPTYAPAWLQQADLAFKRGRYPLARTAYERRLQLEPRDPWASLGLVRLALIDFDRDAAKAQLQAIISDHPDFSAAHNLLAQLLAEDGDEAGARRHRWLGHEAGRFEEAPDPWMREVEARCFSPDRLRIIGMREFQNGRNANARENFERAVEVDPDDPGGHELLGDLYLKIGELDLAQSTLQEARRRYEAAGQEVPISVYLNLGEALRNQGEPAAAVACLEAGVGVHPESYELQNSLGVALNAAGRSTEAMAAFRAALAVNPADADTNYNLARMLFSRGARAEAMTLFERSLQQKPTYPQTLLFLATNALAEGRLADAQPYVERLFDAYSGVPEVRRITAQWHLQRGLAARREGEGEVALAALADAFRVDPELPRVAELLGNAYVENNDYARAIPPLEVYQRQEANRPQAAMLLAQAYAQERRFPKARRLMSQAERLATQQGDEKLAAFCRQILGQLPR